MFKRAFSFTFILSSLGIIGLAYPLFAGIIEPNAIYGFSADVPLENSEWIDYNRVYGSGMFAFGSFILFYHIIALRSMKSISNGTYALRGLLVAVLSIIPASIIMYIIQ